MSSRNDPRRQVRRESPLSGLGASALGDVPFIRPQDESAVSKQEIIGPIDGELGWTPFGQMIAVRLEVSSDGETKDGKIMLPDGIKWLTSVYRVLAAGNEALKYVKVGDFVLVPRNVEPSVVIFDGKKSLYIALQQCHGYINERRAEIDRGEAEGAAQETPAAEPAADPRPAGPE